MRRGWPFVALVLTVAVAARADQTDVTAAEDAAQAFQQHAGSAQAIQENLTQPLLSDAQMLTPDGTTFDAQLICQQEDAFMEVLITPSATGDVGGINIQHDTTMDGSYDRLYSPPMHASGVCANGFISCTPGSWSDCRNYQWTADASNNLGITEVGLSQLGGCYCVNNHCGSGLLVNNLDTTVSAIGAGAAAALAANNPYYAITNVRVNGPTAEYFGQNTAQCGAPGPTTLTNYVSSPTAMTGDANAQAAVDATYQLMASSPAATQSNLTSVSCNIRRSVNMDEVQLNDIIDYNGGSGSVSPCGTNCLQLVLGRVGNNYWGPASCSMFEHSAQFNVLRPDRIVSATLSRAVWDDWIQVRANSTLIWSGPRTWTGTGNPPGRCELSRSWDRNLNVNFTNSLTAGGLVDFNIRVAVAGYGEGYAYARVNVDTSCELQPDVVLDGCQAYQTDPDCSLVNETVDGVETVRNHTATGLTPIPSTVTIGGVACSADVTRDWWEKNRTYSCLGGTQPDLTSYLERKAHIEASATPTSYQDRITDTETGAITLTDGTLALLDEVPVPACVSACKTRRERTRNDVGRSGVVSDANTSPATYDMLYHECDQDNVCPLGPGEEIVKDCGCIDEFAEASVVMQLIRMGGQDIICSSGTQQPVQ